MDAKSGFNPNEPRIPAGNSDGGQWTGGAGSQAGTGTSIPSSIRDNPLFTPAAYRIPASQDFRPAIPQYDGGIKPVSQQDWNTIHNVLDNRPETSDAQILAYSGIFAAEGGFKQDTAGTAVAGIPQPTLDWAKDSPYLADKLKDISAPSDLKNHPELVPDIYQAYFDDTLKAAGGSAALDKIGNDHAAAALADTVFREGKTGGAEIIKDAVNKALKEQGSPEINITLEPGQSLVIGPKILEAYSQLAKNPATLGTLLDNVAETRIKYRPKETSRPNYFRFEKIRTQGREI